jgi:hypothetical protein
MQRVTSESSFLLSADNQPLNDDSDPLEDLLGPLPPSADGGHGISPVHPRGRGAYRSGTSNIDTHFTSNYNPALDVQLEDEISNLDSQPSRRPINSLMMKNDDSDMALEALRDRALWKQRGAERLHAAGFNDQTIGRLMSKSALDRPNASEMEGKVEDVRWSKKGEGREWDRGKVMDEDGHIDVKAPW